MSTSFWNRVGMPAVRAGWVLQCLVTLACAIPLRLVGVRLVVVDDSVSWVEISPSSLIWRLFMRGAPAVRMRDLCVLSSVWRRSQDAESADAPADSAVYAACIASECLPWELDRDDATTRTTLSRFQELHLKLVGALAAADAWFRIGTLIYAQGYAPAANACRTFAVERGRRVLSIENCADKARVIWDDVSGITVNRNLARSVYFRYENAVRGSDAHDFCEAYLHNIRAAKAPEHKSGQATLAITEPYVLFLGQVLTDSSIIFGTTSGWGPLEAILATIAAGDELGFRTVIKLHPKEARGSPPVLDQGSPPKRYDKLTYRRMQQHLQPGTASSPIVDDANSYDTYSLISSAAAVVTVNSQSGLEAAIMGVPVVTCGTCFYGGLGFTSECDTPDSLRSTLARSVVFSPAVRQEHRDRARRFFTIYHALYCAPKSASAIARLAVSRGDFPQSTPFGRAALRTTVA